MTPKEVLARVLEAGGRVIPDPERPRLLVPAALRPLVLEHREALRGLIRQQRAPAPTGRRAEAPLPYTRNPWPDEVPGLGPRGIGPLIPCAKCGRGSWVRYGETALCLGCATPPEGRR